MKTLINKATIINEGKTFLGAVLIHDAFIEKIYLEPISDIPEGTKLIDAQEMLLIPGVIDDQVHFREPGLMHKADIASESRAAVAGGITSFMDMPNVNPQTTTQKELAKKFEIGANKSLANYSFYMGATNDNLDEVLKTNPQTTCGIKVFMGSSTGNMLVNKTETLEAIFKNAPTLVATHCEDEETIRQNTEKYRQQFGETVPIEMHPKIRSEEACYLSSSLAVRLAQKHGTRLHVLHLSTAKELELFEDIPLCEQKITAEVCVHHLWFSDEDYSRKGTHIKWNPAVKARKDRDTLLEAVAKTNRIAVIATDHAPHTLSEKDNSYFKAPSGGPMVQHSLVTMLELAEQRKISQERVVEKMCHAPAELFQIDKRGYIREGYYADLVLIAKENWQVDTPNILYKCAWSPLQGQTFSNKVVKTFVNGQLVYNQGTLNDSVKGMALRFNR